MHQHGNSGLQVDILLSLQAGHARDILTLEPAAREADCKYIAAAIENERLEKRNQELTEMVMNMERTATQTNRELQQCRAEKQVAVTHQAELFTLRPLVKGANERVAAMMAISVAMRAELTERDELLKYVMLIVSRVVLLPNAMHEATLYHLPDLLSLFA